MERSRSTAENTHTGLIRATQHFINAIRYLRRNPGKPSPTTYTLWQSERALEIP